jgi:uncharacterized membrane protein YheB (UPF0754 family)
MNLLEFLLEYGAFLAIPIVSALVGWCTNILAIRMTFFPVEFKGIGPFGWQGIIPMKAEKMASKAVDLITSKLMDVESQFSRIDPKRVADEMAPYLDRTARRIVNEVMEEQAPRMWKAVPQTIKAGIYKRAAADLPKATEELMEDVKENIVELFDVKNMVVEALCKDRKLLNKIFLDVGQKEFKFIEQSGLYFGFSFGLVQMAVWYFFPQWFLLPLAGLMVGWATNWLALRLIFYPQEPKNYGGVQLQGLFIKRQSEVSEEYAHIIASNILTSENIFYRIMRGPASDRLMDIVKIHVEGTIDQAAGATRPWIKVFVGTHKYERMKEIAATRFMDEMPQSIKHTFDYAEEALDIEHTLCDRLQSLPPGEFVGVLRPAFQEDEWKLILTGAILGMLAGGAQLALFFRDIYLPF